MPRILSKKISDLHSDPANVRTHNEKNIEAIMASLKRFGQQKPIIIDSNNIVRAGNGTLAAAKKLGWDKIDTVKSNLEPTELTAYAIADNRTAELAEWDLEGLEMQLGNLDLELRDIAFDDFGFKDVQEVAPPDLPEGEESDFTQMTFTLHKDQAEQVKASMEIANKMGEYADINENKNGNALSRVCEIFVGDHG